MRNIINPLKYRGPAQAAQLRIAPYLRPSPLIFSDGLSRRFGRAVWLKAENLNPTGSFKIRAAFNGMLANLDSARKLGVIASSSGNFAQAVAFAARELSVDAQIVMTSSTQPFKIERTRALGAEVVLCGDSFDERWETTYRLERESGRLLLHPYDSDETIAGNATIALELADQGRELAEGEGPEVFIPVSGGGLLAGIAPLLKELWPRARIIAVQSELNGSLARSLEAGLPVRVPPFRSVADALVALSPGKNAFGTFRGSVDEAVSVPEGAILEAVRLIASEQKLLIEPGAAVTVAALRERPATRPAICILSGGNLDPRLVAG